MNFPDKWLTFSLLFHSCKYFMLFDLPLKRREKEKCFAFSSFSSTAAANFIIMQSKFHFGIPNLPSASTLTLLSTSTLILNLTFVSSYQSLPVQHNCLSCSSSGLLCFEFRFQISSILQAYEFCSQLWPPPAR